MKKYYYQHFSSQVKEAEKFTLKSSFAVLDAAIWKLFKSSVRRKILTEAYIQYDLIHYEVGVYGLIELRGIKKDYSELTFHEPLLPAPKVYGSESLKRLVKDFLIADEPLPEFVNDLLRENWNVQGQHNQEFFVWLRYVMDNGGYLEMPRNYVSGDTLYNADGLYEKRKLHFQKSTHALVDSLKNDGIFSKITMVDEEQEIKPWEKIPENNWDREAIKMWCEGNTNREIGYRVSVEPRTVTNRISILRKQYPEAHIPTDKERRRLIIEKIHDIT